MKRRSIYGAFGGVLSLGAAPVLATNGMYFAGFLTLVLGIAIIDWIRDGN